MAGLGISIEKGTSRKSAKTLSRLAGLYLMIRVDAGTSRYLAEVTWVGISTGGVYFRKGTPLSEISKHSTYNQLTKG
jgi:hypothetical protein